jgi:hypothetical protein
MTGQPSTSKKAEQRLNLNILNTVVSGDIAYIVVIERSLVQTANMQLNNPQVLRSTQVFRKERQWKSLHRHGDHFLEKKAPSADIK